MLSNGRLAEVTSTLGFDPRSLREDSAEEALISHKLKRFQCPSCGGRLLGGCPHSGLPYALHAECIDCGHNEANAGHDPLQMDYMVPVEELPEIRQMQDEQHASKGLHKFTCPECQGRMLNGAPGTIHHREFVNCLDCGHWQPYDENDEPEDAAFHLTGDDLGKFLGTMADLDDTAVAYGNHDLQESAGNVLHIGPGMYAPPGYTGLIEDSLGRIYYFLHGKRTVKEQHEEYAKGGGKSGHYIHHSPLNDEEAEGHAANLSRGWSREAAAKYMQDEGHGAPLKLLTHKKLDDEVQTPAETKTDTSGSAVGKKLKLSEDEQATLIKGSEKQAFSLANKNARMLGMSVDDAAQEAFLAMVKAAQDYDPNKISKATGKPISFNTLAFTYINQHYKNLWQKAGAGTRGGTGYTGTIADPDGNKFHYVGGRPSTPEKLAKFSKRNGPADEQVYDKKLTQDDANAVARGLKRYAKTKSLTGTEKTFDPEDRRGKGGVGEAEALSADVVDAMKGVLDQREQDVLKGMIMDGEPSHVVGAKLGISGASARRLRDGALKKIKEHFASRVTESLQESASPHEFSSTQFSLDDGYLLYELRALAAAIPNEHLTGSGREIDHHLTCLFGLHTNDAQTVAELVQGFGPIKVKLGKTSVFPATETPQGERDVVKVDVHSSDLVRLHKLIADSMPHTSSHPVFVPHMTVAYVKPGFGKRYAGMDGVDGIELELHELTFSSKDGRHTKIELCCDSMESLAEEFGLTQKQLVLLEAACAAASGVLNE